MDYYELLRITPSATFEEVHKAYRSLALQYHPDRNAMSDAVSKMTAINEAYFVLSEPVRRRDYDEMRAKSPPFNIAGPILRAAHETLLKQGWVAARDTESMLLLEQERRAVRVHFVPRLDNASLRKMGRQFTGFSVVLAVQIQTPINLSLHVAVIDLIRSAHHGAPFPDEVYHALFASFL